MLRTFEPGGWAGGKYLRQLLLDGTPVEPRTELLLFLADRSGHLDMEITPALSRGHHVICERYTDSTLAYQTWGRGIESGSMERILEWCNFPVPDLTILLDVDVGEAMTRLGRRGRPDRMESDGGDFMRRVALGYKELAGRCPGRIVVVDAGESIEQVAESVRQCVEDRLRVFGSR